MYSNKFNWNLENITITFSVSFLNLSRIECYSVLQTLSYNKNIDEAQYGVECTLTEKVAVYIETLNWLLKWVIRSITFWIHDVIYQLRIWVLNVFNIAFDYGHRILFRSFGPRRNVTCNQLEFFALIGSFLGIGTEKKIFFRKELWFGDARDSDSLCAIGAVEAGMSKSNVARQLDCILILYIICGDDNNKLAPSAFRTSAPDVTSSR